jgi:MgtC family protein
MGFVHSTRRHAESLSLDWLDDSMPEDNPVRFIDTFGDALQGALIGFECSLRGRSAGFRTHTLVCLTSSLLEAIRKHLPWQKSRFVRE